MRDDRGQVLLLSIGLGVLALLLVLVVVAASGVHLERKRLIALADACAVTGAGAVDVAATYSASPPPAPGTVVLTPQSVRAAVTAHLDDSPLAERLAGLELLEATTSDGRTAEVSLRALARPAVLPWMLAPWSDGIEIRATALARAW